MKEWFVKLLVVLATPLLLIIELVLWLSDSIVKPLSLVITNFIDSMEEDWKELLKGVFKNAKNKKEKKK